MIVNSIAWIEAPWCRRWFRCVGLWPRIILSSSHQTRPMPSGKPSENPVTIMTIYLCSVTMINWQKTRIPSRMTLWTKWCNEGKRQTKISGTRTMKIAKAWKKKCIRRWLRLSDQNLKEFLGKTRRLRVPIMDWKICRNIIWLKGDNQRIIVVMNFKAKDH